MDGGDENRREDWKEEPWIWVNDITFKATRHPLGHQSLLESEKWYNYSQITPQTPSSQMITDKPSPSFKGRVDNVNEAGSCSCTVWARSTFLTLDTESVTKWSQVRGKVLAFSEPPAASHPNTSEDIMWPVRTSSKPRLSRHPEIQDIMFPGFKKLHKWRSFIRTGLCKAESLMEPRGVSDH